MSGSPKENGTDVKLFCYDRTRSVFWFLFCFHLRTFWRRGRRKDHQWRIQNLEKEHTVFVWFGDDPCFGMAKPYCAMVTWRNKVSVLISGDFVSLWAWIDRRICASLLIFIDFTDCHSVNVQFRISFVRLQVRAVFHNWFTGSLACLMRRLSNFRIML